jgi:hypothetical protein
MHPRRILALNSVSLRNDLDNRREFEGDVSLSTAIVVASAEL